MIEWIQEHLVKKLPGIIFLIVVISQIVRGFKRSKENKPDPEPRFNELEEHRRTQAAREEIQRKIAARRAAQSHTAPASAPAPTHVERAPEPPPLPPVVQRDPTAIPEMPEPLRRMIEHLEQRKRQQPSEPVPAPAAYSQVAHDRNRMEVERQEQLAEELRVLEENKMLAKRHAAHVATARADEARTEGALRAVARGQVLQDLHDPESLRRAFVLREVLGTPVGLR
ncbi:MAG: hypothetical protein V4773_19235 [Verrucomicrobiota bacterium]